MTSRFAVVARFVRGPGILTVQRLQAFALGAFKRSSQIACGLLCIVALSSSAAERLLANAHIIDPANRQGYVGHIRIDGSRVVSVTKSWPADFNGDELDLTGK